MRFVRAETLLAGLLALLAVGMSGCRHKEPPPAPVASTAPPLPPSSMTQSPTVPKMPPPAQPKVGVPGSDEKAKDTQPEKPVKTHRSKKHVTAPPDSIVASTGAGPTPPPVTPGGNVQQQAPATLGELAPGTGADSHERAAMNEQIHTQELRLSRVKQPLSEDDKAIRLQVQAFLTKAKQAVSENDLDGAQTLTTKAKVLLDELSQT